MLQKIFTLGIAAGFSTLLPAQTTWYVPDDFATIQAGINGASAGDTVIVRDGTYFENINFNAKAIHLMSENGPATTIIDGSQLGSVVTFHSGEGHDSVFEGFMVTNGQQTAGAGMYCLASSPTVKNCNFSWNSAIYDGGGMYFQDSDLILQDCTFAYNTAVENGGGLYSYSSTPTLLNCEFLHNTARIGGGMRCSFLNPYLANCTFAGNLANYGGAMYTYSAFPYFLNCTLTENTAYSGGGLYCYLQSWPTMINCILWNNQGSPGPDVYIHSENITITYSDVGSGWSGTGIIAVDPMFADPGNGDFQLLPGSPCIDSGDPNSPLDPDGTPADMGAIPFDHFDDDQDDDGLLDIDEVQQYGTDPMAFDTDSDGLGDGMELGLTLADIGSGTRLSIFRPDVDPSTTTDPLLADTDGGGMSDGNEDFNLDGAAQFGEFDPSLATDDRFQLSVPALIAGTTVDITVSGARPGSTGALLHSLHGPGPTATPLGFSVELTEPLVRHQAITLHDGSGVFPITIPAQAPPGMEVWVQAVERLFYAEAYRTSVAWTGAIE